MHITVDTIIGDILRRETDAAIRRNSWNKTE